MTQVKFERDGNKIIKIIIENPKGITASTMRSITIGPIRSQILKECDIETKPTSIKRFAKALEILREHPYIDPIYLLSEKLEINKRTAANYVSQMRKQGLFVWK